MTLCLSWGMHQRSRHSDSDQKIDACKTMHSFGQLIFCNNGQEPHCNNATPSMSLPHNSLGDFESQTGQLSYPKISWNYSFLAIKKSVVLWREFSLPFQTTYSFIVWEYLHFWITNDWHLILQLYNEQAIQWTKFSLKKWKSLMVENLD